MIWGLPMNQHLKWQSLLNNFKEVQNIFFNNGCLKKDKENFKKDWTVFVNQCVNDLNNELAHFSDKNRWDFAFFMLCELNETFPFEVLQDKIAQIPLIHQNMLNQEQIDVIMECIETAKYEYGFTINDMGEFAEILAVNNSLNLEKFNLVLKLILQIGDYNLTADEFQEYIFDKFENAKKARF